MSNQEMDQETQAFIRQLEKLAMIIRAIEGKPVDAKDIITRLTNVKNILERSRFPTYPQLERQIYLRLVAETMDEAAILKTWADMDAQALISYRGQSRKEYVDMVKRSSPEEPPQQMYIGGKFEPPQKRGWFSRFRKREEEPSEFVSA